MSEPISYVGEELTLFEKATKWKQYFSSFMHPYIKKKVIEVGAGIGANTIYLNNGLTNQWLMAEPDRKMFELIERKIKDGSLPANCRAINGTISLLEKKADYNTILYIDVLEHIEKDKEEIQAAAELLTPGGHLIILSPAFQSLYSPFDKQIGHFRRYTKKSLQQLFPPSLARIKLRYIDSAGYFLSLSNRLILKQKHVRQKQVNIWDRYIVPLSGITDRIVNYSFGKSILGVWKKEER